MQSFDDADAFNSWVQQARGRKGPMSLRSADVYRSMWHALSKWAREHNMSTMELHATDFLRYVEERAHPQPLQARYVWRLLRLVERVSSHASEREPMFATGASSGLSRTGATEALAHAPTLLYANARAYDAEREGLSSEDTHGVVTQLHQQIRSERWQDVRNAATVALHLSAGLTPAEVRRLLLEHAKDAESDAITATIDVPGDRHIARRAVPLTPWAAGMLREWMSTRARLEVPGRHLFPSTRTGKPWSKSNHDLAVRSVMLAAAIPASGGAYRLRHTFAIGHLRNGMAADELAALLGVQAVSIQPYIEQLAFKGLAYGR